MKTGYFPHYYKLLEDKDTAYYLLAKEFPVAFSHDMGSKELWEIHDTSADEFKKIIRQKISSPDQFNKFKTNNEKPNQSSYLDLKVYLSSLMLF